MSEPLKLSGRQIQILREGIVGAYPDPENLWYLLAVRMEVQVSAIARGDAYKNKVFALIQDFEAEGRIEEFIRVIVNDKPNSPYLVAIKKEFASILGEDIGNSGEQDTTGAASLDLGEITKNTDWYNFKDYRKPLGAIAPPKDRALKVIFIAAEPREIEGQVRYEEQEKTILEAIQRRPIDINVEESGCLEELRITLDEYKSDLDILHLVGVYEQGYLITEDEYGNQVNSTAEDIFRAIEKASPRLVILCDSDKYGEGATVIAERLIEKGLEAVITLKGDKSETLMTTLYRQLASGNTLEDALREIHRQYKQTLTDFLLGVHLANQQLLSHPLVRTGLTFTPKPVTIRVLDGVGKFKEMTRANFIGRRRQLQNCLYALRNGSEYIGVFLHGGGGLGKSSIASRLSFGRLSNYEMIFWSDWQKGVTPLNSQALIDKLKKANSIFREPALLSYLNESTEETLETNLRILFDELNQKGKPLLLIFDDFEWNLEPQEDGTYKIRPERAGILQAVIEAVLNTNHKIIITCRYNKFDSGSCILPHFYPQGLEPPSKSDLEKLFRRLENFNSDRVLPPLIRGVPIGGGI